MREEKKTRPIRQSVDIDCPIEEAFALFAERFGAWWPLAKYSVTGDAAETCAIEPWFGGRVFERSCTGEEHDWGLVSCWDPPRRLSLTWDPSHIGDSSQTVDIDFDVHCDGTRVTLTHTGWEAPGAAVCMAGASCTTIWAAAILDFFFDFVADQMVAA